VVATKLVEWAAKALNPAAGTFSVLFNAAEWLVTNVREVNKVLVAVTKLGDMVEDIKAGETDVVAREVEKVLKAVAPVALDLALQVLGVKDIPKKIFDAIKSLRNKIAGKVDAIVTVVVKVPQKILDAALAAIKVGNRADYAGLIGAVVTFKVGKETHRLWAVVGRNGTKARFILASNPADLDKSVAEWKEMAKTDPEMQRRVNAEQASQAAAMAVLRPADAASQKLRTDLQSFNPNGDAKQQAAVKSALRASQKGLADGSSNLKQQVGDGGESSQPLPVRVKACMEWESACFAAGTPLLVPGGSKPIERFQAGDLVLSRSEFDPAGPVEPKVVEEVFRRFAPVLHLHVGGQVIRTTGQHPFYAYDKGWVPADKLSAGDRILTAAGDWVAVEEAFDTGEWEAVFNLRVADYHTYFVGDDGWGFAVWAHNNYDGLVDALLKWFGEEKYSALRDQGMKPRDAHRESVKNTHESWRVFKEKLRPASLGDLDLRKLWWVAKASSPITVVQAQETFTEAQNQAKLVLSPIVAKIGTALASANVTDVSFGIRGSLYTGWSYDDATGQPGRPWDPDKFDVDAYVKSNTLHQLIPAQAQGGGKTLSDIDKAGGFRPGEEGNAAAVSVLRLIEQAERELANAFGSRLKLPFYFKVFRGDSPIVGMNL
jgi:hypothetical protein